MKKYVILISMLMTTLIVLFLPFVPWAAEKGSALKSDVVRMEPFSDAKKTGNIARGENLEITATKGAWVKIKTAKANGWVRLLSVKRGRAASDSQLKGVLDVASGRAGTGKVVATTGVRGLSEEDLRNAKFNEAEVKKLESYTQTFAQGSLFAKSGGLKAITLSYLPESGKGGEGK